MRTRDPVDPVELEYAEAMTKMHEADQVLEALCSRQFAHWKDAFCRCVRAKAALDIRG